jgi:hypothetical protein
MKKSRLLIKIGLTILILIILAFMLGNIFKTGFLISAEVNQSQNCTDSDGGLNYILKGTANDTQGNSGTDHCNGIFGNLTEYYCSDGKIESTYFICSTGCSNGVCVRQNQSVCYDSDLGLDYYTYGYANYTLWNGKINRIYDVCENSSHLWEAYCYSTGYALKKYQCPQGCVNGTCNPLNTDECSFLSDSVKNKIWVLQSQDKPIILKERDPVYLNQYVVVPNPSTGGQVIQLITFSGNNYQNEKIEFKDAITNQIVYTSIFQDGMGALMLQGRSYLLTYFNDQNLPLSNWYVKISWSSNYSSVETFYCKKPITNSCSIWSKIFKPSECKQLPSSVANSASLN